MTEKNEFKPYPIEVAFPDITCYRQGNTDIAYVHTFDSGVPGPHVTVNALTHGNEVCGAIAVAELLDRNVRPIRGKLTLSFANVEAYARFDRNHPDKARFVEEDFNRLWSSDHLDGARDSVELRRAREMRSIFDETDYLLDLHSMHESSEPLILSGDLEKGIHFAERLGSEAHIIVDKGHVEGRRLRDYAAFGDPTSVKNALLVECGQHWEARAVDVARDTIVRFLRVLGVIDSNCLEDWVANSYSRGNVIRITDAIVARTDKFRFVSNFVGLEKIDARGTLIGSDGNYEVRTPYDNCILVMPSLRQLRPGVTVVRLGRLETHMPLADLPWTGLNDLTMPMHGVVTNKDNPNRRV